MEKVRSRIIQPTVDGLAAEKIPYCGFIFFGLINCGGDPYVIEYNCRMGDPETQSVMPRIGSDFLAHLHAAASETLKSQKIIVTVRTAVSVVAVSGGYPEKYAKGMSIDGIEAVRGSVVFQSGTKDLDGKTVTSGGRVLAVTTLGDDIAEAREGCYRELSKIHFDGMNFRRDIGCDLMR